MVKNRREASPYKCNEAVKADCRVLRAEAMEFITNKMDHVQISTQHLIGNVKELLYSRQVRKSSEK